MSEDTPNETPEKTPTPLDAKWIVSNVLGIIYFLEGKFGPQAVEEIVAVSTDIEKSFEEDKAEE